MNFTCKNCDVYSEIDVLGDVLRHIRKKIDYLPGGYSAW